MSIFSAVEKFKTHCKKEVKVRQISIRLKKGASYCNG